MADIPNSQCHAYYPVLNWDNVLSLHYEHFGPPPANRSYWGVPVVIYDSGDNPVHIGYEVYCEGAGVVATYRLAVNYELGSPPTNSAVTTHDWHWLGEDLPGPTDFEPLEAKYDAFFEAIKTYLHSTCIVVGYRWSQWKGDYSGTMPSLRFATRALAGSGNNVLPPQVACAITEENEVRRRWGRFYLPFLTSGYSSTGRFSSAFCDAVGVAAKTLLTPIEGDWEHVTVGSKEPHELVTTYVRVDDVPDVIRSRRWAQKTYRYRSSTT